MSFCAMNDGSLLFTLSEDTENIGFTSTLPSFNSYLKNDLRDDIFRLMDLEAIFSSLSDASQERIIAGDISVKGT